MMSLMSCDPIEGTDIEKLDSGRADWLWLDGTGSALFFWAILPRGCPLFRGIEGPKVGPSSFLMLEVSKSVKGFSSGPNWLCVAFIGVFGGPIRPCVACVGVGVRQRSSISPLVRLPSLSILAVGCAAYASSYSLVCRVPSLVARYRVFLHE